MESKQKMKVGEVLASRKGAGTIDELKQFFLEGYFTYSNWSKKISGKHFYREKALIEGFYGTYL